MGKYLLFSSVDGFQWGKKGILSQTGIFGNKIGRDSRAAPPAADLKNTIIQKIEHQPGYGVDRNWCSIMGSLDKKDTLTSKTKVSNATRSLNFCTKYNTSKPKKQTKKQAQRNTGRTYITGISLCLLLNEVAGRFQIRPKIG